jgi:hypothetical protein
MSLKLNDTTSYHLHEMETLGWELTVCNTLEPAGGPCRGILKKNRTFGNLLYDHLSGILPMDNVKKIIEVGGGYGYLMRDFLSRNHRLRAVMLDISGFLLQKQRETLKDSDVAFIKKDFFDCGEGFLSGFDLALFNENIGDFPTLCGIEEKDLCDTPKCGEGPAAELNRLIKTYSLPVTGGKPWNFNLGAVGAVEKLCTAGVRYVYMSEHSCEAAAPEPFSKYLDIRPAGDPERIRLRWHDEYTIKFSHLEKVARAFHYSTMRGRFADFIEIKLDERINFILSSNTQKDEHEIIRLFIDDLFKYEYLILKKD